MSMDKSDTLKSAADDLKAYTRALIANDTARCVAIERRYDVYGYPPEIVGVALAAAAQVKDTLQAVDDYLNGDAA